MQNDIDWNEFSNCYKWGYACYSIQVKENVSFVHKRTNKTETVLCTRNRSIGDSSVDNIEINDIEDVEKNEVGIIPITSKILECIGSQCDQHSIQLDSVEIKVLDLPNENKTAVFDRMSSERNNIAAAYILALDTAKESLKNGKTTLFIDKDSPLAEIFQGVE